MKNRPTLFLSTKAKTLESLKSYLIKAEILPLVHFSIEDYKNQKDSILNKCIHQFKDSVIVRSSSLNEDNLNTSNAGAFTSKLNIPPNKASLNDAVLKVIDSYQSKSHHDEILIQPMLQSVSMSGVVFTSDLDTLSPYYIVNYDLSGSTESVTSGQSTDSMYTFIAHKSMQYIQDQKMNQLLDACQECEHLFDHTALDIEFAFSNNKLYILQVRSIVKANKKSQIKPQINLDRGLEKIYKKIQKLNSPHPKLIGQKTIFGVMPDWNPAEIIGLRPKQLALSLYKELITDHVWAYQRDNYGYRNLRSYPLLISFLGIPFIDTRVSFNSFIPKTLPDSIASKLVDYYLEKFSHSVTDHDKIEFKITYSCYYFGISKKLSTLLDNGFNHNEIKRIEFSLLDLTNKIINPSNGVYQKDLSKIQELPNHFEDITKSSLSLIDKIYWLIEDCKRYGTLPFAGIARSAFISVQFLNAMVDEKIITQSEYEAFFNSLYTISKELNNDLQNLSKKEFITKYGHLRPGTYDITSPCYDESPDKYFTFPKQEIIENEPYHFQFSHSQKEKNISIINRTWLINSCRRFYYFFKKIYRRKGKS